jgi:hypothetical protein
MDLIIYNPTGCGCYFVLLFIVGNGKYIYINFIFTMQGFNQDFETISHFCWTDFFRINYE